MNPIRTILCPVDLSPLSRAEVGVAAELARALGAGLVLHHNLSTTGPGMSKGWEWKQSHGGTDAAGPAEGMKALLEAVPDGVEARTLVTTGPLAIGIKRMAEELPADLVILGCHGATSEDHSSLTELLLHHCDCPILTLHDGCSADGAPRLDLSPGRPLRLLVPNDLSPGGTAAVRYAFELAARLSTRERVKMHLLHVVEERRAWSHRLLGRSADRRPVEEVAAEAEVGLRSLVPDEMADRVAVRVMTGRPEEAILHAARELAPDLVVMGEHARDPFGRLLTSDVARHVLHSAPCPVWFVPPPRLRA